MVSVEKRKNMKLQKFIGLFSITLGFVMVIFAIVLIASISFAKEKESELNTRGAGATGENKYDWITPLRI